MSDELAERFRRHDWDDAIRRLLHHAAAITMAWGQRSVAGYEPQDVVDKAIEMTLDGTRRWDWNRVPDLNVFLRGVIRSLLSKKGVVGGAEARSHIEYIDPTDPLSPEAEVLPEDGIADEEMAAMFDTLMNEVGDDRSLRDYVEAIRSGFSKPSEVAELMGVDVHVVYEHIRKLIKIIRKIRTIP